MENFSCSHRCLPRGDGGQGRAGAQTPARPVAFLGSLLSLPASASRVRSLWAVMDAMTGDEAKEALRSREGIPNSNATADIGAWSVGDAAPLLIVDLPR
jgi:hypothetical protein